MFGRKKCPRCGKPVKNEWNFCPYCGYNLRAIYRSTFDSIFEEIERSFQEMFKSDLFKMPDIFEDLEKFDRRVRGGGISIRIESGTGMKPKVYVKTFGDYKKLEPEIKKRLRVTTGVVEEEREKPKRIPKITEEPEVSIRHVGTQTIVEVDLPDVKSEKDIEVKKLEQSIEIKAYAGDKAYFKIIPIPGKKEIVEREFRKGKLKIVLE